jgi:hypothetical protein
MKRVCVGLAGLLASTGCAGEKREGGDETAPSGISSPSADDPGGEVGGEVGGDEDDSDVRLDVGSGETEGVECQEGQDCGGECIAWEHQPCDMGTTDLFKAMGLNCPGEENVTVSAAGSLQSMGIRTRFGTTNEWDPREGNAYAVIGSGFVTDLDMETPNGDPNIQPRHCNDEIGELTPGAMLPDPLRVNNVGGDCTTDASLIGTGDCSNTVQGQFSQGGSAFDYAEVRIEGQVPATNNSLSYDFAFFSTEYPFYYNSEYNDMYIGWLESESWTGNISFDMTGEPISLNAGFLDFRDDGGNLPEFDGTCMRQHAGTRWLNTTAPVTPGEHITLVLAIFDLSDPILDSYAFLDNFQWGCEGTDRPQTMPVG